MNAAPGDTVLVVDDDAVLRDALREALVGEGLRIGCVDNGREAIDVLRAGARPSVILLDLHTPEKDGLEFRSLQRSDPAIADIPLIVLTGDLDRESEARRLGVAFYLTKPMPSRQLVEVVAHSRRRGCRRARGGKPWAESVARPVRGLGACPRNPLLRAGDALAASFGLTALATDMTRTRS